MALRLEELHPSLVHVPVAFLPLAVAADLFGRLTGRSAWSRFGVGAITVAAAGAVASALTGLIAGEEVNVEGRSRDMLMTHRNLNAVATVVAIAMALWRRRHGRASRGYIAAGLAGVGIVAYTGYLGGELVYRYGVGVDPAKGIWRPDAPKLRKGQTRPFLRDAAVDVWHGVQHMGEELAQGKIVPALVASPRSATEPRAAAPADERGRDTTRPVPEAAMR